MFFAGEVDSFKKTFVLQVLFKGGGIFTQQCVAFYNILVHFFMGGGGN